MSELLNGIFECLDINSSTGLATKDSLQNMTPFQRLFYTQVHEKIGIDAVYFLRDANGIAKVPLMRNNAKKDFSIAWFFSRYNAFKFFFTWRIKCGLLHCQAVHPCE